MACTPATVFHMLMSGTLINGAGAADSRITHSVMQIRAAFLKKKPLFVERCFPRGLRCLFEMEAHAQSQIVKHLGNSKKRWIAIG